MPVYMLRELYEDSRLNEKLGEKNMLTLHSSVNKDNRYAPIRRDICEVLETCASLQISN